MANQLKDKFIMNVPSHKYTAILRVQNVALYEKPN